MCSVSLRRSAPATGNAGVLQRLDHGVERVAAPPHQHQHVAVAQRPAACLAARHGAAADQRLDLGLDAPGQLHFGAGRGDAVERRAPALRCPARRRAPRDPRDRSGSGPHRRAHWSGSVAFSTAWMLLIDLVLAEHVVDRMQDRRARAERIGERRPDRTSARRPRTCLRSARRRRSNSRGAAPWNEKIDCFSSPTANTVRFTPSRAPAPEVNSEMICATMSHCRGLVSCASSISTWSTPRSSL